MDCRNRGHPQRKMKIPGSRRCAAIIFKINLNEEHIIQGRIQIV